MKAKAVGGLMGTLYLGVEIDFPEDSPIAERFKDLPVGRHFTTEHGVVFQKVED